MLVRKLCYEDYRINLGLNPRSVMLLLIVVEIF
jgi:hypothetical protein